MPKQKQRRPRLISILTIFLLLQAPLLIFLGLNLLTNRWSFLTSWPLFWTEIQAAFSIVVETPGELAQDEVMIYSMIAFFILESSAAISLLAGLSFPRGKATAWILGLMAQIGTLMSGIGLYFVRRPPQAYWLLVVGVVMVLYLNYKDVRQWFLQPEEDQEEPSYA
jgi:hypothetical protein